MKIFALSFQTAQSTKQVFCYPLKKFSGDSKIKMDITDFAQYLATKELSDGSMKAYLRYYRSFNRGLSKEDLSQSYINRFILKHPSNVTRAFLKNLFEFFDIYGIKEAAQFKVPNLTGRRKQKKRRSLSAQEIKVLRAWLYHNKDIRYLLMFDLSYFCALRRSEVLKIQIRDFDLTSWVENPSKSCRLLIKGKGNKERYVPVPSKTMMRIINYIENKGKTEDDRLFSFNYTKWHNTFKDAVRSTLDYNYTLHDLRRSRATYWIEHGIDISRVKTRLGHASIQTTQVYINLDEKKEYDAWANE